MTLTDFNSRLQAVNPLLHVRQRGYGDIAGIFLGSEYIARMNHGELNVSGYRYKVFNEDMTTSFGNIQKRGRKTLVRMLEARGLIKNQAQRASLLWGI